MTTWNSCATRVTTTRKHLESHPAICWAKPPYFLGPLYGHVLGAFYVVWERDFAAIKVFQCILGAGSCVLLYHIGRRVFDQWVGILAASILSLYGLHIYYHGLMLPTTLVLFVNLLFLLTIIPRGPTLSLRRCLIASGLIGIAAMAKSNALLLLPAAGVTIWLCYGQQSRRRRAALALSVAAGGALMLAPLVLRNYLVTDEFILITTSTGSNFLKGNGPSADGAHRPLPAGQRGIGLADHLSGCQINAHRAVQESREMTRLAWQHIVDHPWIALQLFGKKLRLFFNATELGIHDQFHFAQRESRLLRAMPGLFSLIAPIGITGMVMGWSRRCRAGMIYATFFAQVVSFVLVFVLARYRVVAVGCLILFASQQIVEWIHAIRRQEWRRLWPSAMLVLVLGACINIPMAEFPRELRFATLYQMTGDHHFSNHDDAAAIRAYRQALEAPDHAARPFNGRADCWTRIAEANQRMGRTAKAILAYRSLLEELEERSPDPMTERINGLRRQIRDLESAVTPSATGGSPPADQADPWPE
ncbi:MAG: glycosyltransferase family 39 protein [Planctomycetes bacterium]|nr:glycosyltransferase family 39 protein [Planctomycetota bacterium]